MIDDKICPLVKSIITHNFFLSGQIPQLSRDFRYTNIQEKTLNLPRSACIIIHTHIQTITYTASHNNMQI